MLSELYIRDFAIIEEVRVQFDFGFNVLTGETGAGKSIILDAVSLILGGRADSAMVRTGSDKALVEATCELTPPVQALVRPILAEQGLESDEVDDVLILSREVRANGRSLCRLNGRTVPLSLLRQIGELLVDIHGQGDHLSLLRPRSHQPLLDAYAGLEPARQALAGEVERLRALERELAGLRQDARRVAQRQELLAFQAEEIEAAHLRPGEEEELRAERTRLANAEHLAQHAQAALLALEGVNDEAPAVSDLLGQAERAAAQLARLDPAQAAWLEQLQGLSFQMNELAAELRDYQEGLEFEPRRLDEVEERLELITRLKRKYGHDIPAILQAGEKARAELERLTHSEERIQELVGEQEQFLRRLGQMAAQLSQQRQVQAGMLSSAVERELANLRMENARFEARVTQEEDPAGVYVGEKRFAFDQSGIDRTEFLISTNPGEPLKPLARVASGGETARLMLALKTALARVDATPTLIFDEIDQGIGGRVGDAVGLKLWGLTQEGTHQVIVVTHLPQLAGYGDAHLQVSKHVVQGRTTTQVTALNTDGRLQELAAMLGTGADDATNGARSILRQVAQAKQRA